MPRTVYNVAPNKWTPNQSDAELRDAATQIHWQLQHRRFGEPHMILPPASEGSVHDADLPIRWQQTDSTELSCKTLNQFTPEDSRLFCFKDCALYIVSTRRSHRWWRSQLYETIYRRWFPFRAEDTDVSHGSFFCQLMTLHEPQELQRPASLSKVASFHTALCARLSGLVPALPVELPHDSSSARERRLALPPAVHRLRPTFLRCFLVMHAGWENHSIDSQIMRERGVIVVFNRAEDAAEHGCVHDPDQGVSRIAEEGLGDACAFRCDSLDIAMKIVLATDPQRSQGKRERHGGYEDWLDPGDKRPIRACRCNKCVEWGVAGEQGRMATHEQRLV